MYSFNTLAVLFILGKMKLIDQIERKLSWRKKNVPDSRPSSLSASNHQRNPKSASNHKNPIVSVTDNEFSQYIKFNHHQGNLKKPLDKWSGNGRLVPIQPTPSPVTSFLCNYRSSSPFCQDASDVHIYQEIEPVTKFSRNTPSPYSIEPIKSTSCRRSRIRTNPWLESPWTKHNYDKLKENVEPIPTSNRLTTFSVSTQPTKTLNKYSHLRHSKQNREETSKNVNKLSNDKYPKSFIQQTEHEPLPSHTLSNEFLAKSSKLCNEITEYFQVPQQTNLQRKPPTKYINSPKYNLPFESDFFSTYGKNSRIQKESSDLKPGERGRINKRMNSNENVSRTNLKRKRTEPSACKTSRKVNQLKSELQNVNVAILEAMK